MIVLTGGAGFIGSAFLGYLNAKGREDILVVDSLGSGVKWKNLVGKRFKDFIDKKNFINALGTSIKSSEVTYIFHLGACSSTTESDCDYLMTNNFRYSRSIGEWCEKTGKRLVYASSAATYGSGKLGFKDTDDIFEQLKPMNMYGFSKHLFDVWVQKPKRKIDAIGLKFFNVFGPNEYHKDHMASVVYKAHEGIVKEGKMKLFKSYRDDYEDGGQKRDFIYVKDCCKLMDWAAFDSQACGIFNVGTGQARTWNDLANACFSAAGKTPNIEYVEMPDVLQGKYQYFTEASIDRIRDAGYSKPFTSLEDGVADYYTNYLDTEHPYI